MPTPATGFPFAVRLLGFGPQETEVFDATFAIRQNGRAYLRLDDDHLQDPDLYIVNAEDIKSLVLLEQLRPNALRPALLIGEPLVPTQHARVGRPLRWHRLFDELEHLIERRADALASLTASDVVAVAERRRAARVDIDLGDPAAYAAMRNGPAEGDAVLVIDDTPEFGETVADALARLPVRVMRAGSEAEAQAACTHRRVAVAIVNTAMEIDAMALCRAIKNDWGGAHTAVVFLAARSGAFDLAGARTAGYDGFLTRPVSPAKLLNALQRFMPRQR